MGCDDRWPDAAHDAQVDRLYEAIRIRKRLAEHPARLSMFTMEDSILLLHLFKEGRTETPSIEQLKRLQSIEKIFYLDNTPV